MKRLRVTDSGLGEPVDGESSRPLCGGAFEVSIRETSQRQLPTDLEHVVSTHGYQTDQRRHHLGLALCHSQQEQSEYWPPPSKWGGGYLTGSLHIRGRHQFLPQ